MSDERRYALSPGTEFEGYRIEVILGSGGFGITYKATEVLLDRSVAIKEFLPQGVVLREADGLTVAPVGRAERESFDWGIDRFRIEAQTLVGFRHPNIVAVHRYFEANGTGYLVMEYVEGRTLDDLLAPDLTLDESEILEILGPLLDGLQAVHDRGFLHRDVKPANIFVRADGTPVLIDFGAARQAFGLHSRSLTAIISAGYAPYEQYDDTGEQGPWTDIYAIGGVLYRCVTGGRPPDAPARVTAMVRGRDDPMAPVAAAAKGRYSGDLLDAITRALAIREDDRPQTIAAFSAMLPSAPRAPEPLDAAGTTLLAGAAAPAAAPPGDTGAATSRSHGRRWRVAVPALVLLVAAAGAAWWLLGRGESALCRQHIAAAGAALGRDDLAAARRSISDLAAADCARATLADLGRRTAALNARIEAKRKAEEEARKQREEAARKEKAAKLAATCAELAAEADKHAKAKKVAPIEALVGRAKDAGCPAEAVRRIRAALELARGRELLAAAKYREAIAAFTRSIEARPTTAAFVGRALSRASFDKDSAKAFEDLSRAIERDPKFIEAYVVRGLLSKELKRNKRAEADLSRALQLANRAIEKDSRDADAYIWRARIRAYGFHRQPKAAIADITRAIEIDPRNASAYVDRARIYTIALKDDDRALADLNRSIRIDPNNVEAYSLRASIWALDKKDYKAAIADYDQLIRLQPTNKHAYIRRGSTHEYGLRDFKRAAADYGQAIRLDTDYAGGYQLRGKLYRDKLGEPRAALADFTQWVRLKPSEPHAYWARATAYRKLGDRAAEIRDLRKALELKPGWDLAGNRLKELGVEP